jgi:lipoxygenase homology domain-containing protein 1
VWVLHAGTDANVVMSMKGSKGFMSEAALETDQNNFERNKQDEFLIKSRDLGVIESITIGHDGTGFGCAWHLAQVQVLNQESGDHASRNVFPVFFLQRSRGR